MLMVIWPDRRAEEVLEQFEAEGVGGVYLIPPAKAKDFQYHWQGGGAEPDDMVVLEVTGLKSYYAQMESMGAKGLLKDEFGNVGTFRFKGSP